jgi:PAS domain S-box-containing protein
MTLTPERAVTLGMLLVLAALVIVGAWAWRSSAQAGAQAAEAQRAQQVLTRLATLQAAVGEAESGQRGQALTGDPAFLRGLAPARQTAEAQLAELRSLVAGSAEQYTRLVPLGPLLARRFEALAAAVELRQRAGAGAAAAAEAAGDGLRLQERLRSAVGALQQQAEADLAAARQRSDASAGLAGGLIAAGSALALLVSGAAMLRLRRDFAALRRAEAVRGTAVEQALQARADLQRVYDTSVDALCVVDAEGRFQRASAGCARIWGWTAEELTATPLIDKVVPDDRRATERALAAALAGPAALDLRNHWRCKDGRTILLHWSAPAPASAGRLPCVARDITALEQLREATERQARALQQAAAELEQARSRADAAERMQAGFIATLGQELRTPASAMASVADLLSQEAGGPLAESQKRQAIALRDRARRMLDLVNDLLDLTALDAGQLVLPREAFDVWEALNQAAAAERAAAEKKGLELRLQLADDLGYARGDAQRVQQVLRKLLRHAVHASAAGSVSLKASRQAGGVLQIEVADSGPGLTAEELARLFTPFSPAAGQAEADGAGLRLAVCQRLARRMGGDLVARSQPPGGTTYRLTLPADDADHG